jgi:hypothetical protein
MKTTAPLYRSINQLPERLTMNRSARNLEGARRVIERLDLNADLGLEDQLRPLHPGVIAAWDQPREPLAWLLDKAAEWCAALLGNYHGVGTWHASHELRNVDPVELRGMLIALGASPFTIEQWLEEIRTRIVSISPRGGSPRTETQEAGA